MRKQRPGTFKKGHKKRGGRKKGTGNRLPKRLREAILQAADQVGSDGKGKDGVLGFLRVLAKKKDQRNFVSLLRPLISSDIKIEPENEVVYQSDQEFRQTLFDRVHPTLLPPPPRDPNEKPPINLIPPKAPPEWEWVLCKKNGSAEFEKEQPDPPAQSELDVEETAELAKGQPEPPARLNAEEDDGSREIRNFDEPNYGTPWNPAPGCRWEYAPYTKSWFAHPTNTGR